MVEMLELGFEVHVGIQQLRERSYPRQREKREPSHGNLREHCTSQKVQRLVGETRVRSANGGEVVVEEEALTWEGISF